VLRFAFIPAQLFPRGPLKTELEVRAQISRCASGAGGRTCQCESGPKGWRGLLAEGTPPMRDREVDQAKRVKAGEAEEKEIDRGSGRKFMGVLLR